jgi:hypothetical protein
MTTIVLDATANISDKSSLRLTHRSGSEGVAGSNYDFIVSFGLRFSVGLDQLLTPFSNDFSQGVPQRSSS